jgi:hypothetical protein
MIYYAKVDRWLAGLLGAVVLLEVAAGVVVLVASLATGKPDLQTALVMICSFAGAGVLIGLILWGCYKTRYEIGSTDLTVRFGPFHSSLPLDAIVEVFPTHNPLSAPAPSLDRLRINYRRKNGKLWFALISPKDKEGFVWDLASAAPQLRSTGDGPLRLRAEEPA